MKKLFLIALATAFVCSFASCQKGESKRDADTTRAVTTDVTTDDTTTTEETVVTTEPEPAVEIDYSDEFTGTYVNPDDFTQYVVVKAMTDGTYLLTYGVTGFVFADVPATRFESNGYVSLKAKIEEKYPDHPGEVIVQRIDIGGGSSELSFGATFDGNDFIGTRGAIVIPEEILSDVDIPMAINSFPVNNDASIIGVLRQEKLGASGFAGDNPEYIPTITLYDDNTFDFKCNMFYGMYNIIGVWFKATVGTETTYFMTAQYIYLSNGLNELTYDEGMTDHSFRLTAVEGSEEFMFSTRNGGSFGATGMEGDVFNSFEFVE